MKTITVIAEITYDDELLHDGDENFYSFWGEVNHPGNDDSEYEGLILHSNFIGDEIGIIRLNEFVIPPIGGKDA